jgi:dolichol-phosphate mannosyltransferase
MRYAMDVLKADIVFEFDADGSHKPEYIRPMLEKIKSADVVVGSRYVAGGSIPNNWGWHRKLFSVLGNQVARCFLTRKYKDFTSGFRATRTRVLRNILPDAFLSSQYAYKLHLFWLLHKAGAVIKEHPIVFIDREKGYSKLPRNSILDSLRVVMCLRYVELKNYFKMCLVGLSGAFVQFGVFNLMRHMVSPTHAMQFAVTSAIISNFIFNNKFTFKDNEIREANLLKRFFIFSSYSFLMVMLQSSWMHFAVRHIGQSFWFENLFVGIGIIAGSVLNYFFYSKIIWKGEEQPFDIKMARR